MFGGEGKETKAALSILEPNIYKNFGLKSFSYLPSVPKENGTGDTVEAMEFVFSNGVAEHTHKEYITDDENKIRSMATRIREIICALTSISAEEVKKQKFATFKEYCDYIGKCINSSKQVVDLKVCGSVYNGKRKSEFPRYGGFIVKAGGNLKFSDNELASNVAYYHFKPQVENKDLLSDDSEISLED